MTSALWPIVLPLVTGLVGLLVPAVLRPEELFSGAVGVSLLLMAANTLAVLIRSHKTSPTVPARGDRALFVIAVVVLAILWLAYLTPPPSSFQLRADDHDYLNAARERGPLLRYLLTPYNEHLCVGTRLLMLPLAQLDDRTLVIAAAWWCRLAALVNLLLFSALLWRLTGTAAVLLPMCALFLVPVADEMVQWFAASQWLIGSALALAACHLSLIDRRGAVVAAAVLAALAPLNYTISLLGILLCVGLSLAFGRRSRAALIAAASATALALGMTAILPETVRTADYGGQSFTQGVASFRALYELARVPGDVATAYVPFFANPPLAPALAASVALAVTWIAWFTGRRRTDLAGTISSVAVVLLVAGYSVPLLFRAWLPHRILLDSGRYHWWPHLALVLLVTALSLAWYRWLHNRMGRRLTRWALLAVAVAYGAALTVSHRGGLWP